VPQYIDFHGTGRAPTVRLRAGPLQGQSGSGAKVLQQQGHSVEGVAVAEQSWPSMMSAVER